MDPTPFNLQATIDSILHALNGVICHILFDASIHGLLVAFVICLVGFGVKTHKPKISKPLLIAAGKLSIFCGALSIPGLVTLLITGGLPETGYYTSNSIGFISFWSLASVWLCGEHINHQWFSANRPKQISKKSTLPDSTTSEDETKSPKSSKSKQSKDQDSNNQEEKSESLNKSDETSKGETTSNVSESLPKEKTYG